MLLASSALLWLSTLGLLVQAVLGIGSPVLLLALVAVQSIAFAISSPTRQAILPRLVRPSWSRRRTTLNSTTFTAARCSARWPPA